MRRNQRERWQEFKIARASPDAIRGLDAISILLLGVMLLLVCLWWFTADTVFVGWTLLSCTAISAATGVVFVREAYLARSRTVTVRGQNLRVRKILRDLVVPLKHLKIDDAEITSISDGSPLHPTLRSYGIGISDYQAGWFRLRNGDKAFLILSDRSRVLHIPTRDGYRLLLSVDHPEALLNALQQQCSQDQTV